MTPGQADADGRDGDPAGGYRADGRRISVLIADDHPVVRQGLRVLLDVQDDIDVIGEAADGTEAAAMAAELRPDVMLLDLKMPGTKGPEVIADSGGPPDPGANPRAHQRDRPGRGRRRGAGRRGGLPVQRR